MDFHLVPRGEDRNYTGFLTKTIVYTSSLIVFLASFGLTVSSIVVPKWISYRNDQIWYSYGLHRRCSSVTDACVSFPQQDDCSGRGRYFCSMWRSVGFLMSFAVVLEGMSIVAYLIILSVIVQAASMSIVAYLYDHDTRFFPGWRLDESWIYCTISWCISLLCAAALIVAGRVLPSEGGYELIPDHS
ncbi:hypothetical protein RU639_009686 [Aspergillus parasiticus]